MMSLCEICGNEAIFLCKCRNGKFCKPHLDRHKSEPGNHQVVAISEVQESQKPGKKSVSFNRNNDSSTGGDGSKSGHQLSEKEVRKQVVRATLDREMNKIIKFREDTLECIDSLQESYIRQIVADTKSLTTSLLEEIAAKEATIISALNELDKPGDIPVGNPIIERIKELKDPEDCLVQCSGDVKEVSFDIRDFMSIEMGWAANPVIEDMKIYYQQNQAVIPLKMKDLFQKIIAEKHYTLKKVNLNKAKIGKEGIPHLVKALSLLPQIEILKLGSNGLGSESAEQIGEAISKLPRLQKLILFDNDLRGSGIQALSPAFTDLKELQVLSLAKNSLGATGARHICLVLQGMARLKEVDLDYNALGAEGARYLAGALPKMTHLKTLKLRNNNLGDDSVKFLKGALGRMNKLELLKLENNPMGNDEKRTLQNVVRPGCKVEF
ncbi:unnamed protein product [Blepharisma stoltei]|uniref:Uncharacterized protein n=1 Tax=Blepharisma stoltei TaxID=1481888 RepID=A0AAU9IPM3_9CILI|nr:unnamed protein product [Blepharisma stoltei]